jgi:hypothetical protein
MHSKRLNEIEMEILSHGLEYETGPGRDSMLISGY